MDRGIPYTTLLITMTVVLTGLGLGAGLATAADATVTELSAPSTAAAGKTVHITATGETTAEIDATLTIKVFRMDTKEKLCEDASPVPITVQCTGTFTMPDEDVEIRAYVTLGGTIPDDEWTTITVDGTATPPINDGDDDSHDDDHTPTPDADEADDGGGTLKTILDGLTDAAKTSVKSLVSRALRDFFVALLLPSAKDLLTMVYSILAWVPDVHPNPVVEDIHRLTFRITLLFAGLAVVAIGLLYQVGPVLGVSYREVRLLLPRLIVALMFAAVSLPLLQLVVDLTNAVTIAFRPEMLQANLGSVLASITTGTVVLLALLVNTMLVLTVVAIYLVLDVYVLFVASLSPLVALAWAFPQTKQYARAFIGGWWTALAAGPLSMLVLRFVFGLMTAKGSTPLQSVTNWMFGIVGFTLLLILPFQMYGASQSIVGQLFHLTGSMKHGARRRYRQYRAYQDYQPGTGMDAAVEEKYGGSHSERGTSAREASGGRYRDEYGESGPGRRQGGD